MSKLITIATYDTASRAAVHKSKLESEGLYCFLADEHINTMNWFYNMATGGIKLQVHEADVELAFRIIHDAQELAVDNTVKNTLQCPECHSTNLKKDSFSNRVLFLGYVLLGVSIPFIDAKYR